MSSHTTTYPLLDAEVDAPTTVPPTGPTLPASSTRRFFPLGNGLLRPFQRDQKGDGASAHGARLVESAMGQILGTRASSEFSQGELPWRPECGSLLYLIQHRENNSTLDELARTYVIQALQRWERRIKVTDAEFGSLVNDNKNTYTIRVKYTLVDTATGAVVQDGLETTITL